VLGADQLGIDPGYRNQVRATGYQEGGSTAAISYSPYLGEQVEQLYHQAVADEAAQAS